MITIITTILRGFGFSRFVEARDPGEAFDLLKSDCVDLIVADFLMDILDGIDFLRLVRTAEDSPNPYIPVIMLTAFSERSRVMAARDAGVTEFCCKPVTPKDLYAKVRACVETPRPFIRTSRYVGPCRRRGIGGYDGPDRRGEGREEEPSEDIS